MKLSETGFTLIELMIVVSIITILSTMALPSYQDRIIRTQIEEGINLAEFVKKDIETYYREKGEFPKGNSEAGLPEANKIIGNYVKKIKVQNGVIQIGFGNKANLNIFDKTLDIRPAIVPDENKVPITWIHGFATVPQGMKVYGLNHTGILSRHLPLQCRL